MKINDFCRNCLQRKNIDAYPPSAAPDQIIAYQQAVRGILERGRSLSAPEISEQMQALRWDMFGIRKDYTEIKRHFNSLMLSLSPHMEQQIRSADDPLRQAVQYAMAGNYIDFAAIDTVDDGQLREKLDAAAEMTVNPRMLDAFRNEALRAQSLVYCTDNCGEIVADKLLMQILREMNPGLMITAIVRGKPVVNDATMEDAEQIGLSKTAQRVMGNGTAMPGTVLGAVSPETRQALEQADLLISKGQGNYEGLSGCGLNIFYLFLCKCERFIDRFHVPQFTGIMTREWLEDDEHYISIPSQ